MVRLTAVFAPAPLEFSLYTFFVVFVMLQSSGLRASGGGRGARLNTSGTNMSGSMIGSSAARRKQKVGRRECAISRAPTCPPKHELMVSSEAFMKGF